MDVEQLTGRYRRLKAELSSAYSEQPWPTGRIDRLAQEIAETEQLLAHLPGGALVAATEPTPETTRDYAEDLAAAELAAAEEPTPVAKAVNRLPTVARNRLTPFGQPAAEPAGGDAAQALP